MGDFVAERVADLVRIDSARAYQLIVGLKSLSLDQLLESQPSAEIQLELLNQHLKEQTEFMDDEQMKRLFLKQFELLCAQDEEVILEELSKRQYPVQECYDIARQSSRNLNKVKAHLAEKLGLIQEALIFHAKSLTELCAAYKSYMEILYMDPSQINIFKNKILQLQHQENIEGQVERMSVICQRTIKLGKSQDVHLILFETVIQFINQHLQKKQPSHKPIRT